MKRIIFLILFFGFFGFVFFTGWSQIKVSPGNIGIIQSKFGGIHEKPVLPGEFSWFWGFLIPKNAVLTEFELNPFNSVKTISGNTPTIKYSFTYSISLSYTPESVMNLLENNLISNSQDLELYLENAASYFAEEASMYYLKLYNKDLNFSPDSVKRNEIIKAIVDYEKFPDIDITVFSLNDFNINNISSTVIAPTVNEEAF